MTKPFYTLIALLIMGLYSYSQENLLQIMNMQSPPKIYAAQKTQENINIDGLAKESSWNNIPWSDEFVDIEGVIKPKPIYETKIKMLWNDSHLYIYAQLEEPHIWGTLTEHDAIIYHDNDFEIFIKPNARQSIYYEIEVNTLNTIMDLMMAKPYRLGGEAIMHWDIKNIKSAIHIEGTLNNPNDIDKYWSVEMAIPFASIGSFGRTPTPKVNDFWQINFSRVQWQHSIQNGQYKRKAENNKLLFEDNWVWSPIGIINMHYPEKWGYIQFADGDSTKHFPKQYKIEQLAWNIFYLQQLYFHDSGKKYSNKLEILPGFVPLLKNETANFKHIITLNKNKTFYKIELIDNTNHLKATIDSFGNYSLSHK